ncbi:hypothetical protein W97_00471 [Coniosporium apollinis CBS 100218]|uniref:G-patch domain-containing protein n=1 Tax=Coniosporium apollinis (strain CBS 100218) TaxID=1168221 RepID=R7YH90_CONA1|nr:uncharacterized protein W97_00471 [Coniosporium apollinis CBS 100218]EON61258.1 hypothetical protein W97_00471 [Coniosporium apollinis CBS 100218]
MAESDDETYIVPLKDQRIFGAGIKRKRVQFVPSSTPSATSLPNTSINTTSLGDTYMSIVLSKSPTPAADTPPPEPADPPTGPAITKTCDICKLPIGSDSKTVPHEASIAHQLCLEHSHPPSAIDRTRKGLSYLQAYGWDPDSRVGLGASGDGILAPIKAKEKRDTVGLGVETLSTKEKKAFVAKDKVRKLHAGEVRKREEESRRKGQKLQQMFYMDDNVQKYLGELG